MSDRPIIFGEEIAEPQPPQTPPEPKKYPAGALFNQDGVMVGCVRRVETTHQTIDVSTHDQPNQFYAGPLRVIAEVDITNMTAFLKVVQ